MPDSFGDKIRIIHALDAIETIEHYTKATDFDDFSGNIMMQDACLRQLQVIGESCRNISAALREIWPEVPWRQIIGMRIIVIHQYFGIDINVIWAIIQYDLPEFRAQLKQILASFDE